MVNFAPKRNATSLSGIPSLPYWIFTPTPRVCVDSLSYADVVTKFSGNDRLPIILRYEAPRALTSYLVITRDLFL